jgi:hypothetical protein
MEIWLEGNLVDDRRQLNFNFQNSKPVSMNQDIAVAI